jgi:hypothetical protein
MDSPTSWSCPNCRRRVPRYASVCHCGARRTDAEAASSAPVLAAQKRSQGWRELPRIVWLWLAVSAVALATLIGLLFVPPEPPLRIPLIAYVDRAPTPTPTRPLKAR